MIAAAAARDITMVEPQIYLEKLSAFSRMLRLEGLAIGPSETGDAAKILVSLGMADRQKVKTALRTVYAKTREEQLTFDRVFDGFFLSEEAMRQQAKDQMEREKEQAEARAQADRELEQVPMELSREQRDAYAAMTEEERQRLQKIGPGCRISRAWEFFQHALEDGPAGKQGNRLL